VTLYVENDGGREAAGFKGQARDCVTRAIAIAADLPYTLVYDELTRRAKEKGKRSRTKRHGTARTGVHRNVYEPYLLGMGWTWNPTMQVGQGVTVHLRADELPQGRLICRLSRHVVAVIDGVVHDTHNPSRRGTRAVYGYYARA
jgi:hypothetical protein